MIKILVLIESSIEFNRRFLSGLIRYSNENGPWTFYRIPAYYIALYGERGVVEKIKEWEIDAVIAQWDYEAFDFLEDLNLPVFLQEYQNINTRFSKISGDFVGTGVMAAHFFIKRQYKNFAYYGKKKFFWSKMRAEGYRREIEKVRGNYYYFESENLDNVLWSKSHSELSDWLVSLPKPVALFACDDNFALQISEICKVNNITIPDELSLLGIDNDELICSLSYPPISSIITDDENGGYNTGRMLHKLVSSKDNTTFDIVIEPIRIELRQSTEEYNISDTNIMKIIYYINKNITSGLSIDEITDLVPLSRRSLEKKFKEAIGISIYQYILDKKADYIVNEILTTKKSLLDIAIDAGLNDVRSAYRIFKNHTGYSPIMFRKKFAQQVKY